MAQALPVGGLSLADEMEIHTDFSEEITIDGVGAQRGMLVLVTDEAGGNLHFTTRGENEGIWTFPQGMHFFPLQVSVIHATSTARIAQVMALL